MHGAAARDALLRRLLGARAVIRVDGLQKSFGEVKAVRGVSFNADDGKITGLLGPNGAGKSTTLRVLYTVLKPDSGTATIDGVDVTRLTPQELQDNPEVRKEWLEV